MKDMIRISGEILKGSVVVKHFYFPDFERYAMFIFLRNISMYIYNILCVQREREIEKMRQQIWLCSVLTFRVSG